MKMKSKPSIAIALLVMIAAACSNSGNEEQTVSGKIENATGKQIDLIGFVNGEPDTIGTQVLSESGEFSIPVDGGRLSFYQLAVENNGALVLAFDSTESPRVEADLHYINKEYSVQGSKDSERICELFNNSVAYETELDSTMKLMRDAAQAGDNANRLELSVHYNDLRKEYKDYLLSFIDADTTSAANFSVLQRLDPKQDGEYFIKVRNGLAPRMQGNVFFDQLANNVAKIEHEMKMNASTGIGKQAPDIVLPNPDGEEIALSSLRGNYVLVDFWASWCKPCRMENPNVVKLYNKYKDENFEIYGVSLDRNKDKWVNAIAEDNLTWKHVSDLQFWNSAAAKLYNVTSIPFTLLIDPDGKIIEKRLRGQALENKLESIYGY
jgi:peroxiredoxin